jgi:tetratricopeptide (TPR) repeat protein
VADRSDLNDRLMGDRLIGISQHYLGDQASARSYLERALAHSPTLGRRSHVRFQLDQRVSARVHLARTLWLQGLADQAMHAAESSPEDARVTNHANSVCYALAVAACPIALWVGDLDAAEHYIGTLLGHSARHGLMIWRALGQSYRGQLAIQRGEVTAGLRLLRAGFDEIDEAGPASLRLIELLMAEALGRAGQIDDGLAAIEEAIDHSERTGERWLSAEFLRVKGELILFAGHTRGCGGG